MDIDTDSGGPNAEAEVKRGKITEVTLPGEKSAGGEFLLQN